VIVPHGGDPFRERVPAAVVAFNGFGKLAGSTQVDELGELETPIALTSTLCVGPVVEALVAWTTARNPDAWSVNAVVGETNDGWLNDGRGRHVRGEDLRAALDAARDGPVAEGTIGAGTGTRCFGFKGGIGTSSRRAGEHLVGVLVQTNFGGDPQLAGVPIPAGALRSAAAAEPGDRRGAEDGSCMIVIATDAPLCARNLRRLAQRAFAGMARTGASFSNGSGDYAIAFSTAASQRLRIDAEAATVGGPVLNNEAMTPLFRAVAEATEEAIWNSLFTARAVQGRDGHRAEAFPAAEAAERVRAGRGSGPPR
jgi:D-aminopeptidase